MAAPSSDEGRRTLQSRKTSPARRWFGDLGGCQRLADHGRDRQAAIGGDRGSGYHPAKEGGGSAPADEHSAGGTRPESHGQTAGRQPGAAGGNRRTPTSGRGASSERGNRPRE